MFFKDHENIKIRSSQNLRIPISRFQVSWILLINHILTSRDQYGLVLQDWRRCSAVSKTFLVDPARKRCVKEWSEWLIYKLWSQIPEYFHGRLWHGKSRWVRGSDCLFQHSWWTHNLPVQIHQFTKYLLSLLSLHGITPQSTQKGNLTLSQPNILWRRKAAFGQTNFLEMSNSRNPINLRISNYTPTYLTQKVRDVFKNQSH